MKEYINLLLLLQIFDTVSSAPVARLSLEERPHRT